MYKNRIQKIFYNKLQLLNLQQVPLVNTIYLTILKRIVSIHYFWFNHAIQINSNQKQVGRYLLQTYLWRQLCI